jgi:hypothetical protein
MFFRRRERNRVVQLPARGGSEKINLPGSFGKKKVKLDVTK